MARLPSVTGKRVDDAFVSGDLSIADAAAVLAKAAGAPHLGDALAAAFAQYRSIGAGRSGRDTADPRSQAAIDCLRALGIEMTTAQRQQFNTSRRAAESRELLDGLVEAGVEYEAAAEYVARQFGMTLPAEVVAVKPRKVRVSRRVIDDDDEQGAEDDPQT